jgi:phosphodiesterase/alkaline phosphatase D-like protein
MFGKRKHSPSRRAVRRRAPKAPSLRLGLETLEDRLTPAVSFLGVGAGDATGGDAILWTRAQDSASTAGVPVKALVSTDPNIGSGVYFAGTTDPAHDYTIHLDATGLQSNTRYYYQFIAGDGTLSLVGTFKTAPAATARVAVHFGFTGDADGQMRPYPSTDDATAPGVPSFAQQNFDYFVWLGDTIYETASGSAGNNNSPATPDTSKAATLANLPALQQAYWTKYREQLQTVSTGPWPGLQTFFSSTGHYTLLDNHELGNKQLINGGAPQGTPAGIGVDATNTANDVNTTGAYLNQTDAFKALAQAYTDYQPIRAQTVSAPNDARSNGTQQLYFAQQWGANSVFFNLDDRSYRDIRLKKPAAPSADDTGPRADNPDRTMLGATQLQWFEQDLLAAQAQGTTWKIVAISSPIDQIGAIGSGDDGGKSWMGGYRWERNQLLRFIADNHIDHVIFLTTDDHLNRVNELGYFTQFDASNTPVQSSYTRVPGAFQIVAGPIGATGPDTVTDHSFANIQSLANALVAKQNAAGVDPLGLDSSFPGLKNVFREGDATAGTNPQPVDFYSPDTFNYITLDLDASGQNLTVTLFGINSYAVNTFPQPGAANPVRKILSFQVGLDTTSLAVSAAGPYGGTATLTATLADVSTNVPLANRVVSFTLGGQAVGTATTDADGKATLPNVNIAAFAPGTYAGAVKAHFAGDAGALPGDGSGSLQVIPAGKPGGFDPATATWYLRNSTAQGAPDAGKFAYGGSNWIAVVGDWDGSGTTTVGVVDPATMTWYLKNSNSAGAPDFTPFKYGAPGWVPVAGDWDGDGKWTVGAFDPATATWYLRNSNTPGAPSVAPFRYGGPGWKPVPGDWDGDGKMTVGVFDLSGRWYLRNTNSAGAPDVTAFAYGAGPWTPLAGDWDGDGKWTVGVVDTTGKWYLRNSNSAGAPDVAVFAYGAPAYQPLTGSWGLAASALRAAGGEGPGTSSAPLTAGEVNAMAAAALGRLAAAGVDPDLVARLGSAAVSAVPLPPGYLGLALPADNRILLSADAAGHGWFVDPTPGQDEEYVNGLALPGSGAAGRMDLLTTVLHELAHLAGLPDRDDSGLLNSTLAEGVRGTAGLGATFGNL